MLQKHKKSHTASEPHGFENSMGVTLRKIVEQTTGEVGHGSGSPWRSGERHKPTS